MRDDNSQQQQEHEEHQQNAIWEAQMSANLALLDEGKLDSEYADYIMEHCGGDRIICNGDTLIDAMESNYLEEDFLESLLSERT